MARYALKVKGLADELVWEGELSDLISLTRPRPSELDAVHATHLARLRGNGGEAQYFVLPTGTLVNIDHVSAIVALPE